MSICTKKKLLIIQLLINQVTNQLQDFRLNSDDFPFLQRLFERENIAIFSFIRFFNSDIENKIFLPIAKLITEERYQDVKLHARKESLISSGACKRIQAIIYEIYCADRIPNKVKEVNSIREVCLSGELLKVRLPSVDLSFESEDGDLYLFDMIPVKPNMYRFLALKRTFLEWSASRLVDNFDCNIYTRIAIPYNPYESNFYEKWIFKGAFDFQEEVMIGKEFWDFLGGEGAYEDLLDCFEQAGIELRPQIDDYFSRFK